MSKFMQYAVTASHEALKDAGWYPKSEEEREMSVRFSQHPQFSTTSLDRILGHLHRLRHRQLRRSLQHLPTLR